MGRATYVAKPFVATIKQNGVCKVMNTCSPSGGLSRRSLNRQAIKVLLLVLAACCFPSPNLAARENKPQLWLISTRLAPQSGDLQSGLQAIRYWQFAGDGRWQTSDEESFRSAADPAATMTIAIHGNRDNADDAVEFAWPIYCRMLTNADGKPFNLVIWSWPSQQLCKRNRPDVQIKMSYCDAQAYYLGWHLRRIKGDVPVCLLGFSMGAKIIGGGLQLLAGGQVNCRRLPDSPPGETDPSRSAPIRAVMIAAAIDDYSLSRNGAYNLALSQVENMLMVRNSCDRVLKWYPRIYGRGGPDALGFTGPSGCGDYSRIELLDVCCEIGSEHSWASYLSSCSLLGSIDRYAFICAPSQPKTDETGQSAK
jgi:hypothetical protein